MTTTIPLPGGSCGYIGCAAPCCAPSWGWIRGLSAGAGTCMKQRQALPWNLGVLELLLCTVQLMFGSGILGGKAGMLGCAAMVPIQ